MLFNSWERLLQAAILGVLTYLSLVMILRLYGKRTLSQMNIFEFVVTVALGSIAASTILNSSVALAEGVVAIFVLSGMQFVMSWSSARSNRVQAVIKANPRLLFYQGEFLSEAMLSERVTREEILYGIRQAGIADLNDVAAVVMETNGQLSVIQRSDDGDVSTLQYVENTSPPDPLSKLERGSERSEQG